MTTAQVIAKALGAERKCQADINMASTVVANSHLSKAEKNSVHAALAKASGDLNQSIKDLVAWTPPRSYDDHSTRYNGATPYNG